MDLTAYRRRERLTLKAFGDLIGCSAETVRRYESRERLPDRGTMETIRSVTGGAVTANDLVHAPAHDSSDQATNAAAASAASSAGQGSGDGRLRSEEVV